MTALLKSDITRKEIEAIFDELFNEIVPDEGPAENQYGEMCRAIMRIAYRYYNDGDYFYTGYGIETCGNASVWLTYYGNSNIKSIMREMEMCYKDDDYELGIEKLMIEVINYSEKEKSDMISQRAVDFQTKIYDDYAIQQYGNPYEEEDDSSEDYE